MASYNTSDQTFKHSKGQTPVIKLKSHPGKSYCPCSALANYLSLRPPMLSQSLFLVLLGAPVTRNFFVEILRKLILYTPYFGLNINTHSFRIGRTTDLVLGGCSDAFIQKAGRWSSTAYKKYIRPQTVVL